MLGGGGWLAAAWLFGLLACNLPAVRPATLMPTLPPSPTANSPASPPLETATSPLAPPTANAAPETGSPAVSPEGREAASPLPPEENGPPTAAGAPVWAVESVTTTAETRGAVTLVTTTTVRRYTVGGQTAADIDVEMRAAGPVDPLGGYHWFALTEPLFDWRYECPCAENGCLPGPVTALLTVTLTLPRWTAPAGAEGSLGGQWAAFEAALIAHEQGHAALAADCAWALGEAIAALPPQPSCPAVDAAARAASEPVFAACRASHRAYEDETDHGWTQGVVWPPP